MEQGEEKKIHEEPVSDRWMEKLIVIHHRYEGICEIKIEMPELICVTLIVTLHSVSLSGCHSLQNTRYHLPHLSIHTSFTSSQFSTL